MAVHEHTLNDDLLASKLKVSPLGLEIEDIPNGMTYSFKSLGGILRIREEIANVELLRYDLSIKFNDGLADIDFIIKGTTDANLFKVDAGSNNIGIGVSGIPTAKFEINGDIKHLVNTNNVSNPPTLAELNSIFGSPAALGAGYTAYLNDNGGGVDFYKCVSDGVNWWIFTGLKAT